MSGDEPRKIFCDAHGARVWAGDLVCAACDRIYFDGATTAPHDCACGARLMPRPHEEHEPNASFSARIACRRCALQVGLAQARERGCA